MTTSRDPNSVIYVGFWKKVLASLIDNLLMLIPYIIIEDTVSEKAHPFLNLLEQKVVFLRKYFRHFYFALAL